MGMGLRGLGERGSGGRGLMFRNWDGWYKRRLELWCWVIEELLFLVLV